MNCGEKAGWKKNQNLLDKNKQIMCPQGAFFSCVIFAKYCPLFLPLSLFSFQYKSKWSSIHFLFHTKPSLLFQSNKKTCSPLFFLASLLKWKMAVTLISTLSLALLFAASALAALQPRVPEGDAHISVAPFIYIYITMWNTWFMLFFLKLIPCWWCYILPFICPLVFSTLLALYSDVLVGVTLWVLFLFFYIFCG